jgi:methylphosphotriester-DNA--protein-cysteine methyltransferase
MFKLIGADGKQFLSLRPGTLGGHRKLKIYGRLDCPSALRFIAKGQYVKYRVFFADEATAIAAGFRPCARCLPQKYKQWKGGILVATA